MATAVRTHTQPDGNSCALKRRPGNFRSNFAPSPKPIWFQRTNQVSQNSHSLLLNVAFVTNSKLVVQRLKSLSLQPQYYSSLSHSRISRYRLDYNCSLCQKHHHQDSLCNQCRRLSYNQSNFQFIHNSKLVAAAIRLHPILILGSHFNRPSNSSRVITKTTTITITNNILLPG